MSLFASGEGATFLVLMGITCGQILVWVFYMMTCRTDDWIRLCKQDEERKQAAADRRKVTGAGAMKAGAVIARIFLKK